MEFDKSKIYTAANADELKVGSIVIVADNLLELKQCVLKDRPETLVNVRDEDTQYRFETANEAFALAYLISEPEEKKLKWTDLKVGDVITDGELECMVVSIDKSESNEIFRICVIVDNGPDWLSDEELEEWEKVEK